MTTQAGYMNAIVPPLVAILAAICANSQRRTVSLSGHGRGRLCMVAGLLVRLLDPCGAAPWFARRWQADDSAVEIPSG